MHSLTEGALDKIMSGIDVEKPILQILGHKKLASSSNGERYRLLVSDGKRVNSFTMLATQLNNMITNNILTEFCICQVNRYAISLVNNAGKQKRVMVILSLDLKVAGSEVGHKIGNPTNVEADGGDSTPAQPAQQAKVSPVKQNNYTAKHSVLESSNDNIVTTPIIALNPYRNKWVIQARVVSKSDIRTWSNSRGEGKLFSMDLVDESGEIRCTAFRDQCDKFYNMLEMGKIYYISRGQLKTVNRQFNHLKNDFEMTLTNDSEIIPCNVESDIPKLQFNFEPITEIEKKDKNDIIDVLGIVKSTTDLQTVVSRNTGKEIKKRDVHLIDESNIMVTLTLWGTQADNFNGDGHPVLAIKGARIGEFNGGKNLSTLSATVIQTDPDLPAAHRLRGWFNKVGLTGESRSLSKALGSGGGGSGPWRTFKEVRDMEMGLRGPEIYTVKATISFVRTENSMYKSCPIDSCKKKLIDQANSMYRCEKCDKEYPNYKYRLLVSLNLSDWSGHQWVMAFNEEAEKILGMTAQALGELKENDHDTYSEKFSDAALRTFMFKLRVKAEMFRDESRLKTTCIGVAPVDYDAYNRHLLTRIKELASITKA